MFFWCELGILKLYFECWIHIGKLQDIFLPSHSNVFEQLDHINIFFLLLKNKKPAFELKVRGGTIDEANNNSQPAGGKWRPYPLECWWGNNLGSYLQ